MELFERPLILTLDLDEHATAWFDALRRTHFPPERLLVGAHVTMFHALPGPRAPAVTEAITALLDCMAPFPVAVTGLRFLGRGVAFTLAAPDAAVLRARLAQRFAPDLTAQDRAPWSPHITVQNKVAPDLARRTMASLGAAIPPPVEAMGVTLWRYENGPWAWLRSWRFDA